MPKMKLQSIQVLRGIAAFCVAMTHLVSFERDAISENGFAEQSFAGGLWQNGFAGVDLFFVISGFIMVYVTAGRERGLESAGDFLFARAARIYPLWWLFVLAMAAVFIIVHGTPYHPVEYGKTDNGVFAYIAKSVFLVPQEGLPILGVGWTLIHEMYFYLVFAALLLLPTRFLPSALATWAFLVIIAYFFGYSSTAPDSLLHVITYPMTIEFILGAFSGLVFLGFKPRFGWLLSLVGGGAFVAAMMYFQNSEAAERGIWATLKWGRVICFGIPATLLVYGLASLERTRSVSFPRSLIHLGDISYAFYLSHVLSYTAVKRLFSKISEFSESEHVPSFLGHAFELGRPGLLDNILFTFACLFVAILLAALSYAAFEKPSLKWLRTKRQRLFRPIKFDNHSISF